MDDATQATQAPEAAAFDRSFDSDRAGYLKSVNDAMLETAGVRYLEVQGAIHPGNEAYKSAYDLGVDAQSFVDQAIEDFGFVRAGNRYSVPEARSHNLAQAAMCEFAASGQGWVRGSNGALFQETEGGVALMRPVRDRKSGRFGFGIEYREGAAMDQLGTGLLNEGETRGRFAGFDMAQAIESYRAVIDTARGFRF